jgi:hypothetical protein
MYIKTGKDTVEYPYSLSKLKAEHANTSFPREMRDEMLAEYGIYPVLPTPRPASTLTQDPVEQTPQLINGVWTQIWAMVDVSAEEAAQRAQDAADAAELQATKADAFVKSFFGMPPSQLESYVNNNTANLAQVRALLTKMALMLLALAKREYR